MLPGRAEGAPVDSEMEAGSQGPLGVRLVFYSPLGWQVFLDQGAGVGDPGPGGPVSRVRGSL